MKKFMKATKKITAIAASAAIVSSSVFAGLSNYPNNFVKDGKFKGQVVVGAQAAAIDTTSAMSVIEELKSALSGDEQKVKISYKKTSSAGGESIDAVKNNRALNYGDLLGDVSESAGFDDGNSDLLSDESFKNGASNEDYEQNLFVGSDGITNYGEFNYALRSNVDGVTKIQDGIYFANGETFATYKFDLKKAITLNSNAGTGKSMNTDDKNDFVGETLTIMGVEYTISDIANGGTSYELSKLELIGGANKLSLGEGVQQTVTIGSKSYDIAVQSVASDKVLLTVNGESKSINLLDTQDIAGISVAVTDLVSSSRDAVKGYAEIVVGGQKISLEAGNVKINDEDVNDLYPDYNVDVAFSTVTDSMDTFTVTYKVDDDVLLTEGDSLVDPLFGAFSVLYEGTNDVIYKDLTIRTDDDDLKVTGTLENGNLFDQPLLHAIKNINDTAGSVYMVGDNDDDRVIFKGSNTGLGTATGTIELTAGDSTTAADTYQVTINGVTGTAVPFDTNLSNTAKDVALDITNNIAGYSATASGAVISVTADTTGSSSNSAITVAVTNGGGTVPTTTDTEMTGGLGGVYYDSTNKWTFDAASTSIKGDGFLVRDTNNEDQYLYQVTTISTKTGNNNDEVDFDELLQNKDKQDVVFSDTDFSNAFEVAFAGGEVNEGSDDQIYLVNGVSSILSDIIAFDNEVLLTLGGSTEQVDLGDDNVGTKGSFDIVFDSADLDSEDLTSYTPITVEYDWDTADTEFNVYLTSTDFVNANNADDEKSNSDDQTFVNAYGVKVSYDNNEKREVIVSVPDEEVVGKVSLVFGDAGSVESSSVIVASDKVADKKAELEAEGYTITGTENLNSVSAQVSIDAPVMDYEVVGTSDLIVVGGPAVNAVARALLGIDFYTKEQAGVNMGEGLIKYYEDSNSILVYGYEGEDTAAAVARLNKGGFTSDEVRVN